MFEINIYDQKFFHLIMQNEASYNNIITINVEIQKLVIY